MAYLAPEKEKKNIYIYNQELIACSLNWPHIERSQRYLTSVSPLQIPPAKTEKKSYFGMEMKHKITVKREAFIS